MKAIVIVNPHARSGRAVRQFQAVASQLPHVFERTRVVVTSHAREVAPLLEQAAIEGYDTVLAVGGDGTNQAIVNALAELPTPFTLASLPLGTGYDWTRTLEIPTDLEQALYWLANAQVMPIDVGQVRVDEQTWRFLNVASVGISGQIGQMVNAMPVKRPWSYLQATATALLRYPAHPMRVWLDGDLWYEGNSFLLAVGNGRFFGRGMNVCPHATINDGQFDVMLFESMSKLKAFAALLSLLRVTHLQRHDVHHQRAQTIRVEAIKEPLKMEIEGEPHEGKALEFEMLAGALPMLVDPRVEAVFTPVGKTRTDLPSPPNPLSPRERGSKEA